jgi:hypothetical protein
MLSVLITAHLSLVLLFGAGSLVYLVGQPPSNDYNIDIANSVRHYIDQHARGFNVQVGCAGEQRYNATIEGDHIDFF